MLRSYGEGLFDYAAEDAWLERYDRKARAFVEQGRPGGERAAAGIHRPPAHVRW